MVIDMSKIKVKQDISHIPEEWVYTYFAEKHKQPIPDILDGRQIRMKSFWNSDSDPSLFLFKNKGKYFFKDFSSGHGGGYLKFVQALESGNDDLNLDQIREIIQAAWEQFKKDGKVFVPINESAAIIEGRVRPKIEIEQTNWTRKHFDFWFDYKISQETLCKYNVVPIERYIFTYGNGSSSQYRTEMSFAFMHDNKPFQIYNPGSKDAKYITVDTLYYPGSDQTKRANVLGILSGYKDIMAFDQLDLKCDTISSITEIRLIDSDTMKFLLGEYEAIFACLDYDATGVKMMNLYKKVYCVNSVYVKLEKDIAENTRHHSIEYLKSKYVIEIHNVINQSIIK